MHHIFNTVIDVATLRAYRETHYCVAGEPPFTLRIGIACPSLASAHQAHGVRCSAFITACNPSGRLLDETTNSARQAELARKLGCLNRMHLDGIGRDPTNHWPGEASFLVLGLALEEAKALGRYFEQNAIVWSGEDAVPQLILLR